MDFFINFFPAFTACFSGSCNSRNPYPKSRLFCCLNFLRGSPICHPEVVAAIREGISRRGSSAQISATRVYIAPRSMAMAVAGGVGCSFFFISALVLPGASLKNHSSNLHAPLCRRFCPNSVAVARYGALIRTKSPTNCDAHLAESLFQTRSGIFYDSHITIVTVLT